MPHVRPAARAIIIQNEKLLCVKMRDHTGEFFVFPGGGQQHGESAHQALKRECLEELGVEVEIHELMVARDYIGSNHEYKELHPEFHALELFFRCSVPAGFSPRNGHSPDTQQVEVVWVPLEELEGLLLYPKPLRTMLRNIGHGVWPAYLGDVN